MGRDLKENRASCQGVCVQNPPQEDCQAESDFAVIIVLCNHILPHIKIPP